MIDRAGSTIYALDQIHNLRQNAVPRPERDVLVALLRYVLEQLLQPDDLPQPQSMQGP